MQKNVWVFNYIVPLSRKRIFFKSRPIWPCKEARHFPYLCNRTRFFAEIFMRYVKTGVDSNGHISEVSRGTVQCLYGASTEAAVLVAAPGFLARVGSAHLWR
jgi:hypothetical protein